MDDEIRLSIPLPLDSDGFLRRQCPNCDGEFKWFIHQEGDGNAEQVTQYFCPLCGAPAGADEWATRAQTEFALGAAGPHLDQWVSDSLAQAFKGVKGLLFKPHRDFTLDLPDAEPLHEPDDMIIVEPPCHPNEPLKVPEEATALVHCLVCRAPFTG